MSVADRVKAIMAQQYAPEVSGPPRITFGGGRMTYNGKESTEADVIILASILERTYYPGTYNPDVVVPPACYAFVGARDGAGKPHEGAMEPQSDACSTCPKNQFGSAPVGKGKACKERVKVALVPASTDVDSIPTVQLVTARASATSTKAFTTYTSAVKSAGVNTFQIKTKLRAAQSAKWKTVTEVTYEPMDALPEETWVALLDRYDEAVSLLTQPYEMDE
jgi:hypothetical protein